MIVCDPCRWDQIIWHHICIDKLQMKNRERDRERAKKQICCTLVQLKPKTRNSESDKANQTEYIYRLICTFVFLWFDQIFRFSIYGQMRFKNLSNIYTNVCLKKIKEKRYSMFVLQWCVCAFLCILCHKIWKCLKQNWNGVFNHQKIWMHTESIAVSICRLQRQNISDEM